MFNNLSEIFKKQYQTLNLIEISRGNLLQNYQYLSSFNKKIKIAPVIKSNGYGHGIINIAKILDSAHAPFFCVDSLYVAYELLKTGVKTPVLIMGYTSPENLKHKKLPFSFALFDLQTAEILNKFEPGSAAHIFVDTGMRREGITLEDLPDFLENLKNYPHLKIEGIMSHLATNNKNQVSNFYKSQKLVKKYGFYPKWVHILNSAGLLENLDPNSNMARVGLALYSINPVLKFISHIVQIKTLKKGETTGYDRTYKAKKDTIIGVLPAGYYDGVDRGLSSKGFVKIKNNFCPIIGRVSMNITVIDVGKINARVGDKVVIYSDNPKDKNSIENTAKICRKIPYEILVNLAESTKRVVI